MNEDGWMESYKMLCEAGIDPALSQHVAHLFVRNPLVIFNAAVEGLDDETMTVHWERIQSKLAEYALEASSTLQQPQ